MAADRIIFWFDGIHYKGTPLFGSDGYVGGKRYYHIRLTEGNDGSRTYQLLVVLDSRSHPIVASGFATCDDAKDFAEIDYILRQFS